jgi:TATA-box binding protein (TBP) (component of TFIID and TFIIIB)
MEDRPEYVILSPCTTSKSIEMRTREKLDLRKAEKELSNDHEVSANTSVFLSFLHNGRQFTIYSSGKIILKEVDSNEGKPLLLEVFNLLKEKGCFVEG